ncbi:MAG: hypothetical protein Tsb0021_13540 [Chlamydiales bacterium]
MTSNINSLRSIPEVTVIGGGGISTAGYFGYLEAVNGKNGRQALRELMTNLGNYMEIVKGIPKHLPFADLIIGIKTLYRIFKGVPLNEGKLLNDAVVKIFETNAQQFLKDVEQFIGKKLDYRNITFEEHYAAVEGLRKKNLKQYQHIRVLTSKCIPKQLQESDFGNAKSPAIERS